MEIASNYETLDQIPDTTIKEIETVNAESIDYKLFFEKYMLRNTPCLIKNISTSWKCTQHWVVDNKINVDYFMDTYGWLEAPVADCGNISYNSHCKSLMKVTDYMHYLKLNERSKLLYLKDWHLKRIVTDNFYEVPQFFADDWLNEYAQDHEEDDFMFIYIGPRGSWTPLHADVYNSYSWSVNIVGRKKWIFFPPGEEDKLKDTLGNLPLLFDAQKFMDVKHYVLIQDKGDAVFVPSGWHHQVENVLDTISINHNWVNGCNIQDVWNGLDKTLISVEREIKDLSTTQGFVSQCQLIVKSLFGMDFLSFINFLMYMGQKRTSQYHEGYAMAFGLHKIGINHIVFDLKSILKTMNMMENHPLFTIICSLANKINYHHDFNKLKDSILTVINSHKL